MNLLVGGILLILAGGGVMLLLRNHPRLAIRGWNSSWGRSTMTG